MTMSATARSHELSLVVQGLRLAYHDSPDSAFVIDTEGRFLMVNPVMCEYLCTRESDLLGQHYDRFALSTDAERIRSSIAHALAGTATRYRTSGPHLTGEPMVSDVTLLPVRIDGAVAALVGTATDLTLTGQAETATHRSEDLLRLAGRVARFGGWSIDAEHGTVHLSEGARDLLEIGPEVDDITTAAWAVHDAHEERRFRALLERCLTEGESFDVESEMVTARGTRLWMRTVGEPERRSDGSIIGARGAILDVTAARSAHERERALESRLTATLASISDAIIFLDHDDRVTYANPQALDLAQRPETDLVGSPLWSVFPDDAAAGFRDALRDARTTGARVVRRAVVPPDGRWFEMTANPTSDGLAIYLRDVTDEQAAAEAAQRAQERLAYQAALLDTARDVMLVRTVEGTIVYWNKAAADLYGWTADEAVGRDVREVIEMDTDAWEAAVKELMSTGFYAGEVEQRTRDGRTLIVDARWQLVRDPSGEPTAVFAVNSDITEWRRDLEARQRAQRLESLGTLAGGIAHDLNNVLTPILMSVQLLALDERDDEKRELLGTVETAVKRGAEMIRQVLTFARGVDGRRVRVDVDRLLDDLMILTRDVVPRGVEVTVHRENDLPPVTGDPTQLLQVLVNLVTNARDAMGLTGHLTISAERLEIADEYTSVSHAAAAGQYLQISVEDSGHGMPPEIIEKIFEPFFTTKDLGRGTGLGLATSLAIVRSHGGFMQVYSEPGRGTRFIVGLPFEMESQERDDRKASPRELPHGSGEVILVVDDEQAIRTVTRRTLEAYGYRVLVASDGREAISIIERGDVDVDLVLTDMMMPVMDGAATSAYLEEHHPHIPIIAASGLNSGGDSTSVGLGIARFIGKPYTTSTLVTGVSDTLREHRLSRDAGE